MKCKNCGFYIEKRDGKFTHFYFDKVVGLMKPTLETVTGCKNPESKEGAKKNG